jgi:hypothetical protein
MSVLPTNRKRSSANPERRTPLQRWLMWSLLLVYGIPACLGPHWHQHDHHSPSSTCQSDSQAAQDCSECDCCAEPTRSVSVKSCVSAELALLDGHRLLHVQHSCAICAYYAQAIVLAGENSLAASIASRDFFSRLSESPWLRSILRANSRGPPQAIDLP